MNQSSADGPETRLAVYGSLLPGERHHELVGDLDVLGTGTLQGEINELDGYPVLRLGDVGVAVAVTILGGPQLAARWPDLDAFEGPAYRRDQVIVELDGGGVIVANCYVAADV